jgi:uncharacterized protein CbrC (UPF0167 family)
MRTENALPIRLFKTLEKLKRSAEAYNDCLTVINSSLVDIDLAEQVQIQRIMSRLDAYYDKEWQIANDEYFSLYPQGEKPQFRYVADQVLDEIFSSKKEEKCSICNEEKLYTISFWVSPEYIIICDQCISLGRGKDPKTQCIIRFHPFNSNPAASANQEYVLSHCTPPIGSFCKNHDDYRWARHCGDYAVYHGDVLATDIPDETIKELVENEGMDIDEFWEWYDPKSPYCNADFHKFECLTCKETLYTYDYSL